MSGRRVLHYIVLVVTDPLIPSHHVSRTENSPIIDSSALNSVCVRLYLDLVMDAMSEYSYDADLAGLSYKLDTQADGIIMHIDGYNDKLYVLTKVVLEKMLDLKVNPQRFEIIKDQNRRKFENFNLAAPSALTTYWMTYLIQNKIQPPQAKLEALETVTPERLQAFIPELLSRMHVEGLVHGNVLKEVGLQSAASRRQVPLRRTHRLIVISAGCCRYHRPCRDDLQAQTARTRGKDLASISSRTRL